MAHEGDPASTTWTSDVVLADGATVHIRTMRSDDGDRIRALCEGLSQESLYFRFFTAIPASQAGNLEQLATIDYDHHFALVAEHGADIIAIARYERLNATDDAAEVAFTVRDDQQGRGVGTILLEHLAAVAREHGIRRFDAFTLTGNQRMLRLFADAGFELRRKLTGGTVDVSFEIAVTPSSIEAQERREQVSEARSVARLLCPTSIAVVGASRQPGTIGNAVLRNVLSGEFSGPVYAVNRAASTVEGLPSYPGVRDIPGEIGLAVVCVPASEVLSVAEDCVAKGVGGLVVVSAGFAEVGDRDLQRHLVQLVRANGMRLIGPNCIGVVNTAVDVHMNATFIPAKPLPGRIGLASQSGGLAIEMLSRAGGLGLGVSSFVSMGNKADISGNDLLQYWDEDPATDAILLYLESFGNPRKFSRLARRIARNKPIIAVKSGRTAAGARGASSHTAALATPDVAVDALFHQAGVIRVDTLEQLFDTASVVVHQPLPAGRRVAIVTNGGGPGILATDACVGAGLEVPVLDSSTQAQLRTFVSHEASVGNPVDLVASASADVYERTIRTLLTDAAIDALLVIFVPPLVTDADDVARAITAAAADAGNKAVVACFLGRNGMLDLLSAGGDADDPSTRRIPSFGFPESAAAAIGRAAAHAEWRRRPEGTVPELADADFVAAQRIVADALSRAPDGGWLELADARNLLSSAGVSVVQTRHVADAAAAVATAADIGFPVALKVGSPDIVHKTDVGGVWLGLADERAVRDAFDAIYDAVGDRMGGAVVQPMVPTGIETIVGVTRDDTFGSLVLFGMGGIAAELMRDTTLRIVPLTDVDANELVRSLRSSPLLFGYRNTPAVDVPALEDLVLRVGRLAEHIPEIAELDCNPVIVSPAGAIAVDAKVRIAPLAPEPPQGIRRLADA